MAYTTAQLVTAYTNANLGKAPDAATTLTLDAYATQSQTGGVSDATALANTLKLVNNTTAVAVETYQFFTGHAPSAAGLAYLVNSTTNTNDLNDAYYSKFAQENRFINFSINLATGSGEGAAAFAAAYGSVSYAQTVASAYDKIIGNDTAKAAGVDVAASVAYLSRAENITYLTNFVKANTGLTAAADIDLAVKAALIGEILNAATVSGLGGYATATTALVNDLADGTLSSDNSAGVNIFTAYPSSAATGKTFVLTTGADVGSSFLGTTGNDTYVAAEIGGNSVFTVGDSIDGGAGVDTLSITQTAAFTQPVAATISNVEVVNLTTGTTGSTIDASTWGGLTALNVVGVGGATVTAGAATNVTVGRQAAAATTVTTNGGNNVSITETGANGGATIVNTAAGAVVVNSSILATAASTGNAITVNSGSSVAVTQKGTNAVTTTVTDGVVTVNGAATTKTVSVTNDKAATADAETVGHVNANVKVLDVNRGSLTAAGSIETVTVSSFADLEVNSGALKTLNLSGTGTTLDLDTLGGLTTAANTALTINSNGLALSGATNIDGDIKTLNLAGSTASSTYTGAFTAAGVTALNISGDAKVTLTNQVLGALTDVVSTNTAGVTLGTALAVGTSFTGGTGADTITLTSGFTKAISLGDGNDTVTYAGAAGVGGSLSGGAGTDTIRMTAALADAADASAAFNTAVTGFEILALTTGAGATINLAGINGVNQVTATGISSALTLDGFTSGGSLTLVNGAVTGGVTANVTNAVLTANDTFNLNLSNNTNGVVAFGTAVLAGIETVNIKTVDAGTGANAAATIDTLTLTDADATSIVVSGNNGLTLANTSATKVTSFDASGVVGNSTTDTAANLAVTYASANATASATVTIVGGAGNDTLTGNAAKDTITGGAGNDTLNGGEGVDTINAGVGHDIVQITNNDATGVIGSGTGGTDSVNGFGLVQTDITASVLTNNGLFLAASNTVLGGANTSLLDLVVTDAGAATVNVVAEADATGVGQGAGVNYDVTDGLLTVSGAGASNVDTLGEWLTEANAVASTDGEALAFVFGADTYVFVQNGTADVLVKLVGVQATGLVEATASTSAAAGSILFHG